MNSFFSVRPVRLKNLVKLYSMYYNALNERRKKWTQVELDMSQTVPKWTLVRVLAIHVVHILHARLNAFSKTGSVLSLFQRWWDPIILEILAKGKLIGCCFMARQSGKVFQINVIVTVELEQRKWAEIRTTVMEYVKKLDGTRIIAISSIEEMTDLLKKFGFRMAFLDDVLYLDLSCARYQYTFIPSLLLNKILKSDFESICEILMIHISPSYVLNKTLSQL